MMRLRSLKKLAVAATIIIALVVAGACYISHANRQSAIQSAIAWARLAPLPPSARNVRVDVRGGMFTREFVITFDDSPAVIRQWLAASPGPATATVTATGSVTTYEVKPGGGAVFAEVTVDTDTGIVVIHSSWS